MSEFHEVWDEQSNLFIKIYLNVLRKTIAVIFEYDLFSSKNSKLSSLFLIWKTVFNICQCQNFILLNKWIVWALYFSEAIVVSTYVQIIVAPLLRTVGFQIVLYTKMLIVLLCQTNIIYYFVTYVPSVGKLNYYKNHVPRFCCTFNVKMLNLWPMFIFTIIYVSCSLFKLRYFDVFKWISVVFSRRLKLNWFSSVVACQVI